jgi:hypothetical protein
MRVAMRRMIGSAVSVLCACLMPAIHAQKAASSPPLAATDPRLRSAADDYLELLHRVQQGDMSVDFHAFRIAGAIVAGPHFSARETIERNTFKRFMAASNPQGALDSSDRMLDLDYASTVAHFDAMMACRALKNEDDAAKHEKVLNALLNSIAKGGDGKTPETSYLAVTTQEEYIFMALRLNVKASEQSLVTQYGHSYDRLKVFDPKTNTRQYLWFNADLQMSPDEIGDPSSTRSPKDSAAPVVIATAQRSPPPMPEPSSGRNAKQYSPPLPGPWPWARQINIGVIRTDSGSTYHFAVNFVVPDPPDRSAGSYLFNLVTLYGYQLQSDHRVDLPKDTFPPMAGDWKPGDPVRLEFDLPKEYADPVQGWNLRFCVGSTSSCLPSSNLLVDSADAPAPRAEGPHIRVENRSGMDFRDVVVNGKQFGDIKAGAFTHYQVMEQAYKYARVSLSTDSGQLRITPFDYLGERQLGMGNFTYVLTIQDGGLRIECVVN